MANYPIDITADANANAAKIVFEDGTTTTYAVDEITRIDFIAHDFGEPKITMSANDGSLLFGYKGKVFDDPLRIKVTNLSAGRVKLVKAQLINAENDKIVQEIVLSTSATTTKIGKNKSYVISFTNNAKVVADVKLFYEYDGTSYEKICKIRARA